MEEPPPPRHFRNYSSYTLSPAYVLGHAFHALARVKSGSVVHGKRGALALLDELFATLENLELAGTSAAAEPLRSLQGDLAAKPRPARLGDRLAQRIVEAVPDIEAAARDELRGRSTRRRPGKLTSASFLRKPEELLGETAYARLPTALRFDLTDGCRAIAERLPTAGVFHLYRVWYGLHGTSGSAPALPVPDPGGNASVRCTLSEAISVFSRIRETLEAQV